MNVKELSLQDLESYFNLVSKIRDGVLVMSRANNDMNGSKLLYYNNRYNLLLDEVEYRISNLYVDKVEKKKEVLNEEVSH